jgi:16S rRNA (cytosine1402-N4)-methyltransferase
MNFAGLPKLIAQEGLEGFDIVIADLGVSSMQIDNPARGFTFKADGPLDLRLNPNHGQSATALLAKTTVVKLATIFTENADEPQATFMAEAILAGQKANPIISTRQLAETIQAALTRPGRNVADTDASDPQRRVFQALRIAVNDEFGALDSLLRVLPDCLKPGGRVAILTFHSGEDRRVKKAFQVGQRNGAYCSIAESVIRASYDERHANPRSSSAKLRWAIRAI